jgi:hypothetical protein
MLTPTGQMTAEAALGCHFLTASGQGRETLNHQSPAVWKSRLGQQWPVERQDDQFITRDRLGETGPECCKTGGSAGVLPTGKQAGISAGTSAFPACAVSSLHPPETKRQKLARLDRQPRCRYHARAADWQKTGIALFAGFTGRQSLTGSNRD